MLESLNQNSDIDLYYGDETKISQTGYVPMVGNTRMKISVFLYNEVKVLTVLVYSQEPCSFITN